MSEFLIGGYTRSDEHGEGDGGVRRLRPDAPGTDVVVPTPDPSCLLRSSDHDDLLYAVDEGGDAVVALRRTADGAWRVAARVGTAGSAPCHLALVRGGSLLLAACYAGGVVSAHPVDADGLPGPATPLPAPDPAPNGPHPAQDGPHAHCSLEVDDLLLVADLGTDRVLLYRSAAGGFAFDGAIAVPPGAGPRDLLRLPSGGVLLLGEHDSRLHLLDLAGRRVLASVPTTIDPVSGDQASGMTITGTRLTVGLRGSDRIALLRVGDDGVPVPVDAATTGGTWPRHHAIDGDRLLVANERSGTVTELPFDSDVAFGTPGPVVRSPSPTFLLADR